jgi:hypothetical protein
MPGPNCLSAAELKAFLLGDLAEPASRSVAGHLEACADCEATARQLDAATDPLICSLRRVFGSGEIAGPMATPRSTAAGADPRPTVALPGAFDLAAYTGQPPTALGRFQIQSELGRGGFGIVFLAEDTRLGRAVALKVPRPEALANPDLRQRFLREARAAAGLEHPNIVPVYEAGEVGGISYIASAYCPGDNLASWLRRQPGPVLPRRAAALVAVLACAVQHAHERGILHRDLKPGNILLLPPSEASGAPEELEFTPKVTDFGLAKMRELEDDQTASGLLLGTPAYMAPEQAAGWSQAVGVASDVYALGVILYEVLTGQVPCRGASLLLTLEQVRSQEPVPPRRLRAEVPRDLEVICLKCLQKAPRDRYASAAALAEDLGHFLRGESIRARPAGPLTRAWRWCRRPERIRDAGLVALFNGVLSVGICSTGLILVCSGFLPVQNLAVAAGYFLTMLGGNGVPELWVARGAAARRVRSLWAGLFLPPLFLAYAVGVSLDLIPSGGAVRFGTDPAASQAQLTTFFFIQIIQVAAFLLALLAYYANRQLPGFLPQRSPGR